MPKKNYTGTTEEAAKSWKGFISQLITMGAEWLIINLQSPEIRFSDFL